MRARTRHEKRANNPRPPRAPRGEIQIRAPISGSARLGCSWRADWRSAAQSDGVLVGKFLLRLRQTFARAAQTQHTHAAQGRSERQTQEESEEVARRARASGTARARKKLGPVSVAEEEEGALVDDECSTEEEERTIRPFATRFLFSWIVVVVFRLVVRSWRTHRDTKQEPVVSAVVARLLLSFRPAFVPCIHPGPVPAEEGPGGTAAAGVEWNSVDYGWPEAEEQPAAEISAAHVVEEARSVR